MVGGDILLNLGESGRDSSTVVCQIHYQVNEIVLLELEHDAADQIHSDGRSVGHLRDTAMEAGSNDHNSTLNIVSQERGHSMEDIHCH